MPERIRHPPLDKEKMEPIQTEIHLLKDQCKGCGYCIEYCPRQVLEESDEINERGIHPPRVVDISKCIMCNFCTAVCPDFAIFVEEKPIRKTKEDQNVQKTT
jgi:2-oxoglutarate ferredoxin oxidoreductase subunit delta